MCKIVIDNKMKTVHNEDFLKAVYVNLQLLKALRSLLSSWE